MYIYINKHLKTNKKQNGYQNKQAKYKKSKKYLTKAK